MEQDEKTGKYILSVISECGILPAIPEDFKDSVENWLETWILKDDPGLKNELLSEKSIEVRKAIIVNKLNRILKMEQFVNEFNEQIKQFETNNENVISNSSLLVFGEFRLGNNITINTFQEPSNIEGVKSVRRKIQKLISLGKIEESIKNLKEITEIKFEEAHKEVIHASEAWTNLARKERIGTINNHDAAITRAQIIERLLNIIDQVLKNSNSENSDQQLNKN